MWWKRKPEGGVEAPSPNAEHAVFRVGDEYVVRRVHTGEAVVLVALSFGGVVHELRGEYPDFRVGGGFDEIRFYGYSDAGEPSRFEYLDKAKEVAKAAEFAIARMERKISNAFADEVRVWR